MTIRPATAADLDAVADIAHDQRIRHVGWQPEMWPMAANARDAHRLALASTLGDGLSTTLVATKDERVVGYVIAATANVPLGGPRTWVVEEFGVAKPKRWDTVGRVLLAALAGRAHRVGVERIVVPYPVGDRKRRQALDGARLDLNCWFRHRRLDVRPVTDGLPPIGGDEPGLPLPHLHGLLTASSHSSSATAPGAHALVTASLAPSPMVALGGSFALANPVIANDDAGLWGALETLERMCRERGDVLLLVAVGPGEEPLDLMLDHRGYGRAVEWWTLQPC